MGTRGRDHTGAGRRLREARPDAKLRVLGAGGELAWKQRGDDIQIEFPEALRRQLAGALAWTLHIPAVRA